MRIVVLRFGGWIQVVCWGFVGEVFGCRFLVCCLYCVVWFLVMKLWFMLWVFNCFIFPLDKVWVGFWFDLVEFNVAWLYLIILGLFMLSWCCVVGLLALLLGWVFVVVCVVLCEILLCFIVWFVCFGRLLEVVVWVFMVFINSYSVYIYLL